MWDHNFASLVMASSIDNSHTQRIFCIHGTYILAYVEESGGISLFFIALYLEPMCLN